MGQEQIKDAIESGKEFLLLTFSDTEIRGMKSTETDVMFFEEEQCPVHRYLNRLLYGRERKEMKIDDFLNMIKDNSKFLIYEYKRSTT